MFHRRSFLTALSAAAALPAWGASSGLQFGPARPFSFGWLRDYAQKIATQPYKPPPPRSPLLQRISYDAAAKILFRADYALWKQTQRYRIMLMHRANYSGEPVAISTVTRGMAREILYRSDYFDYSKSGVDPEPLGDLGFAGFRAFNDQLAFQRSYFRSSGQDGQFGASARGIAVNTALQTGEEFPRFSRFWLEENGPVTTVYALLEGPSLAGAYKYDAMLQNGMVMNVHCDLFFRADVSRLGAAPLTSMYWYGENQKDRAADWRPEVHDNDGLAIWNGRGEHIWRPLINPRQLQTNSFIDNNPKGFGLMQRDRSFENYQDDSAFYNKRPGIWVEPKGQWGPGAVQLVEIPTSDEIHDNIVAYWRPDAPVSAGDALSFDYRLYWQNAEPAFPKDLSRVIATRIGRSSGNESNIAPGRRRFAIDFTGGSLATMAQRFDVTPVISSSSGKIEGAFVIKVVGTDHWRAIFDLVPDERTPVDLRCSLRLGDRNLSETWIYQYFP